MFGERVILVGDVPAGAAVGTMRLVIRVLIADDQSLVRTGFRVILEAEGDIQVVSEAANGVEAVRLAALDRPDVILMDIRMPELDGLAATEQILSREDPPTVVVLTTFDQNEYVYRALRAGAAGFLLKDAPSSRLIAAVRAAATGDSLIEPSITQRLVEASCRRRTPSGSRRARRAHRARARRPPPARPRALERRDRRRVRGRRVDGEDACRAHPDQARRARPSAGGRAVLRDRLRDPVRMSGYSAEASSDGVGSSVAVTLFSSAIASAWAMRSRASSTLSW